MYVVFESSVRESQGNYLVETEDLFRHSFEIGHTVFVSQNRNLVFANAFDFGLSPFLNLRIFTQYQEEYVERYGNLSKCQRVVQ